MNACPELFEFSELDIVDCLLESQYSTLKEQILQYVVYNHFPNFRSQQALAQKLLLTYTQIEKNRLTHVFNHIFNSQPINLGTLNALSAKMNKKEFEFNDVLMQLMTSLSLKVSPMGFKSLARLGAQFG